MKTRTTVILLLLATCVGLYIKFYESKRPNSEEAKRQSENVVNFKRDAIEGVVIQNGDDRIELRRQDKKWRIEAPVKDQADGSVVDNILFDLESWQKEATITAKEIDADKNKLAEYGVSKAKLRLKLLGKDAPPEIFFGNNAALEGRMYVRLENSKETFIASQNIKNAVAKKPEDFRDKKLTDLATAQVSRVVIKNAAGELELQKRADHWDVVRPLRARADDSKIGDLVAQVTTARIQQFVAADSGDLKPYGLMEPRGAITLFGEDDKQGKTLQIGSGTEKQPDQVYVRFSPRGSVYTLPKKVEELLNTKPNDLRDRHLVRVDENQIDRITIEAPGKGKTVLGRKEESWTIVSRNNAPANAAEVRRFLELLKNEQVTRFVEDVASNLSKYGLDKPQLSLTLSAFASENTAESKAGEQPLTSIAFGGVEGDSVFARVGDEPFVIAVRRAFMDGVLSDPLQWQDAVIFKFKPEAIHRLTVGDDIALARGPNNQWTWAKGGEINQTNVQSLLNTLSSLRAARWAGATVPQQGLGQPQLAITFTTSPDDKQIHSLVVGQAIDGGMWFARTDEREGTFVISNPDLNALKLPLVQTAPPAFASPSPANSAPRPKL